MAELREMLTEAVRNTAPSQAEAATEGQEKGAALPITRVQELRLADLHTAPTG